jgi:hypothetical protein
MERATYPMLPTRGGRLKRLLTLRTCHRDQQNGITLLAKRVKKRCL